MNRIKRLVDCEQYFTHIDLAQKCVQMVENTYDLNSFRIILEPSAGDGAFYNLLPRDRRVGIDIKPLGEGIREFDFFRWKPPLSEDNILTIGNPPFGQRGSLAIAFLNRACEFSRVIAFILPRSFKKDTFTNRIHSGFHLVDQFDCEKFRTPTGDLLKVKSVFQIWERRVVQRDLIQRMSEHPDFDLKHAHLSRVSQEELKTLVANYDFAIAQVGSNFAPKDPHVISAGSHWFVKEKKHGVRLIFEKLNFSFLEGMNLSFTSLSKKDIIQAYEKAANDS